MFGLSPYDVDASSLPPGYFRSVKYAAEKVHVGAMHLWAQAAPFYLDLWIINGARIGQCHSPKRKLLSKEAVAGSIPRLAISTLKVSPMPSGEIRCLSWSATFARS